MPQNTLRTSTPLALRGVRNVRDLGGYPFTDEQGRQGFTKTHLFLRSGALGGLKRSDIEHLRSYGVRRVVDVRSNFELRIWRDPFAGGRVPGVDYIHIPLMDQLNSNGFQGLLPERMFNVYRDLIDNDQESFRTLFEVFDGEGCTLFHCRAGKDRTGVIAMLLLGLAGVGEGHIVADYAATGRYMGRGLKLQRLGVSILLRKKVPRCLFEADPHEMERTLAHINKTYGGIRRYLEEACTCPAPQLNRIAARLRGQQAPAE